MSEILYSSLFNPLCTSGKNMLDDASPNDKVKIKLLDYTLEVVFSKVGHLAHVH